MRLSSLALRDVAETVRPHPSMRGGAVGSDAAVEGADVAVGGRVWAVLDNEQPLLGPDGQSQGHTTTAAAPAGLGMVVVSGRNMMGQCLATGGCQTLQLLLISVLIISKHYKAHPVGWTKFKIQTVGTVCANTLSLLLFLQ
jgi:hypothetical protein